MSSDNEMIPNNELTERIKQDIETWRKAVKEWDTQVLHEKLKSVIYFNFEQNEAEIQRITREIKLRLEYHYPVLIHHPSVRQDIDITNLFKEPKIERIDLCFPNNHSMLGFHDFNLNGSLHDFKTSWNGIPDRDFIWHGGTYQLPKKLVSDKAKQLSQKEKQKRKNKNKAQKKVRRVQRLTPNPDVCLKY